MAEAVGEDLYYFGDNLEAILDALEEDENFMRSVSQETINVSISVYFVSFIMPKYSVIIGDVSGATISPQRQSKAKLIHFLFKISIRFVL